MTKTNQPIFRPTAACEDFLEAGGVLDFLEAGGVLRPIVMEERQRRLCLLLKECHTYARSQNLTFVGLTLYDIQKYLKRVGINADATREGLRKLHGRGIVTKELIRLDGKKIKYALFRLTEDASAPPPLPEHPCAHYSYNCTKCARCCTIGVCHRGIWDEKIEQCTYLMADQTCGYKDR